MTNDLLKGKRVLIVDDEPDVFETLEELLSMCTLVEASTFEEAKRLLEQEFFDIAILDIMGVNGYKLLEIANEKKVPAVMLTAHALSVDDTVKSFKGGAASYVPKEEIIHIAAFLEDVLVSRKSGKNLVSRWFERLGAFYDKKFGPDWQQKDKEFWEKYQYWI
ncbi:MAG: response regulator [Deltaproteobacteria bacterium]|nr:response regulator [Deltaproteobacteria bacterium]